MFQNAFKSKQPSVTEHTYLNL